MKKEKQRSNNKNKHTKIVTTSGFVYMGIGVVAALFIVIGLLVCDDSQESLFMGLGTGIASSVCVAILIDISNTKSRKKQDKENLDELSRDFRRSFLDFRDSLIITAENRFGCDGEKRTFNEWLRYCLQEPDLDNETEEDFWNTIIDISVYLNRIDKTSRDLYEKLLDNLDNTVNTREKRQSIKRISWFASNISNRLDSEEVESAIKTITTKLVPTYLKIESGDTDLFDCPYSEDRWT